MKRKLRADRIEIIAQLERIELEHIRNGSISTAITEMNELNRHYPGQYLIKIALAEAHILCGDQMVARKLLFVASNLDPTDFRYRIISWFVENPVLRTPDRRESVIQYIEEGGTNAFNYCLALANYLAGYGRLNEQREILELLTDTHQQPKQIQELIVAYQEAGLASEIIENLRRKTRRIV